MLGVLDLNKKKNKLYINSLRLKEGVRVIHGLDDNFRKIDPKIQETYFNRPSNYKPKDNVITIFGDESVEDLLDLVLKYEKNSKNVLMLICASCNDLFPDKTRRLFEKIRLDKADIYKNFKKTNLKLFLNVGKVKGIIQEELEREGLWKNTNFLIRIIRRIKFLLSNKQ